MRNQKEYVDDIMEIIKNKNISNLSDENYEKYKGEEFAPSYERRNLSKSRLKRKICEQIPEENVEQKVFFEAIKEVYSHKQFLRNFKEAEAEKVLKGILENLKREKICEYLN